MGRVIEAALEQMKKGAVVNTIAIFYLSRVAWGRGDFLKILLLGGLMGYEGEAPLSTFRPLR